MKTIHLLLGLLVMGVVLSFKSGGLVNRERTSGKHTIRVNGRTLINDAVTINNRGILTVVNGDARADGVTMVPFRLSLKRSRMLIGRWPDRKEETLTSVSLNEIWQMAQPGDELLVEVAGAPTIQVVRVIRMEPINWLPFLRSGSDSGC